MPSYFVYDKTTGELVPYAQASAQPGFNPSNEIIFDDAGNKYVGEAHAAAIRANAGKFDVAGVLATGFISYLVPVLGEQIGASLMASGALTSAQAASDAVLAAGGTASQASAAAASATATASAVGTAVASTTVQVAQGVPLDKAAQNATVTAIVQTQAPGAAKAVNEVLQNPNITNLIVSTGASIAETAGKGGTEADIVRNATGALVGSGVSSATDSKLLGRTAAGAVTGGVSGALTSAAGTAVSDLAKQDTTTTTPAPTTPAQTATLTPDLTPQQVSQIQNSLGISVSEATNNDVKLALAPLLPALGAGAAIVSDSVIPLIGIFGAKAISDTLDYYTKQNDAAGFAKWVNENMQVAEERLQNNLPLNPAGAGRGFVNPPVVTNIQPSQAAISGTTGAGFSGEGGGSAVGATAGESTAGEQEARDFLTAQKATHPEIDFATLAKEPALNEPPSDKAIVDLITPKTSEAVQTEPTITPADREILALSGITPTTPPATTAPTLADTSVTPTDVRSVPSTVAPVIKPSDIAPGYDPLSDLSTKVTVYPTEAYEGDDTSYVPPAVSTPPTTLPTTTPTDVVAPIDIATPVDTGTPTTVPPDVVPPTVVPPAVEPPVTERPVVDEFTRPDVVEPPPSTKVEVEPDTPVVEPTIEEVAPPAEEEKPPVEEEKPPGKKEEPYKPDTFIYSGKKPIYEPRTSTNLGTTLQAPFYPSTTLGQALTGYRGAGEIEGKKSGKPRQDVWNEESLRLKDALGL